MGLLGDFVQGAAGAGAGIIGNRIDLAQQSQSRMNMEQMMTPILKDREMAIGEVRNALAVSLNKANADMALNMKDEAAQSERDRIAQFGGDPTKAQEAGDLESAKALRDFNDTSQSKLREAQAGEMNAKADYWRQGGTRASSRDNLSRQDVLTARKSYDKHFDIEDSISGGKSFDSVGHGLYLSMFNGLVKRGVDPQDAADAAWRKVSEARSAAGNDPNNYSAQYADLSKKLSENLSNNGENNRKETGAPMVDKEKAIGAMSDAKKARSPASDNQSIADNRSYQERRDSAIREERRKNSIMESAEYKALVRYRKSLMMSGKAVEANKVSEQMASMLEKD